MANVKPTQPPASTTRCASSAANSTAGRSPAAPWSRGDRKTSPAR